MSKRYLKKKGKKAEMTEQELREAYLILAREGARMEKELRSFFSDAVGFGVGKPMSVVPLVSFRCGKCRSTALLHITYKKATAIICTKCSNTEVFDPLEPVTD